MDLEGEALITPPGVGVGIVWKNGWGRKGIVLMRKKEMQEKRGKVGRGG